MVNVLDHTPADIVRALLVQLGEATEAEATPLGDWPCYATREPNMPDNCVSTFDTVGRDGGRIMQSGELLYNYGFQVRVRAVSLTVGWLKMDAIRKALAESVSLTTVAVGADRYLIHCVCNIGPALPLGTDSPKTNRRLFTTNALLTVRKL